MKIVKKDVGGYPEGVTAAADFSIYELSGDLPTNKAEADALVAALVDVGTPVFSGTTTTKDGTSTYYIWTKCDPTKNYVVAETGVKTLDQTDYDTLNKDDKRVVWYRAIKANPNSDPEVIPEYELDNVYSTASVTLVKDIIQNAEVDTALEAADTENAVVKGEVETLLSGDRKVCFSLTPTVETHNQALSSFVLNDTGLTFVGGTTEYAITSIIVGKASQTIGNFWVDPSNLTISATVTWLDKDGETISSSPILDLSTDQTMKAPEGARSFSIDYYSEAVKAATSNKYVLSSDFQAGMVTVNMTVKQQPDGTIENPVEEVTAFVNAADVTLKYPKWYDDGSGFETVTVGDEDTAKILVRPIDLPIVKIEKTSMPSNQVEVGSNITYYLTVSNLSKTASFVNPVVLDMMPTGITFTGTYEVSDGTFGEKFECEVSRYLGKPTLTYASASGANVIGENETGVVFSLTGELMPESSFTITLEGLVGDSTVLYGDKAYNFTFLSSSKHVWHTANDRYGYSFKNTDGVYPGTLPSEAQRLDSLAAVREGGLHSALGNYASDETKDFVWVNAKTVIPVTMKASMTLVKAIQGDQDSGYSSADNFLATSTRTNSTPGDEQSGWVNYRLAVTNGTENAKHFLVLGDVLPGVTDGIDSKWDVVMDSITSVVFAGSSLGTDKYTLFYYTGDTSAADSALNDALIESIDWTHDEAWPQIINKGGELPSGWSSASSVADLEDVTAFLIVFDSELVLKPNESIIVAYHTLTEDIPSDDDFAKVAFANANNRFKTNWQASLSAMTSNTVSVVLMDGRVAVEGDVWIDEDWDGTQESANRRDYSEYAIINALADALSFSINDERVSQQSTSDDDQGGTNTSVGESIKHFSFTELGAAYVVEGKGDLYVNETLNPKALKTTDPYNYSLNAILSDATLLDVFKLTTLGAGNYMSDDPDENPLGANAYDNNFFATSLSTTFKTKPFYLRYSALVDQSKDIGFQMVRDLELTKLAADDPSVTVEGAKFKIYGPFDEGKAALSGSPLTFKAITATDGSVSYAYDPNGTVTEIATDANGKILVTGLNWWKEYVFQETVKAPGYDLENATASADSTVGTVIAKLDGADNAWVLKLPDTGKMNKTEKVKVSHIRKTTAVIESNQFLDVQAGGKAALKKGDFTISLYDADMKLIQSVPNDADGKVVFDAQTFTSVGTFTYYIKENVPAKEDQKPGYYYSDETITVKVQVAWDKQAKALKSTVTYYNGGVAVDIATITNVYKPDPAKLSFPFEKTVAGNQTPSDKQFKFTLTSVDGAPMPKGATGTTVEATVTGTADGSFGAIEYAAAGTYTYTVTEYPGKEPGYAYDESTYTVSITVTDNNGVLSAADPVIAKGQQGADEIAFTNTYTPKATEMPLSVKKSIQYVKPPVDKKFTFTLAPVTENAPMPKTATVSVTGEGTVDFENIKFTEAGIFEYTLTEKLEDYTGYVFDKTTHTVKVVVTDTKAVLGWTCSIDGQTATTQETTIYVTNNYKPEPTTLALSVEKGFEGNERLYLKTFEFTITPNQANAPMPSVNKLYLTDKGDKTISGSFPEIKYTEVGTWTYNVRETIRTTKGYEYDDTIYTATVVVTDNDGQLVANWYVGKPGNDDPMAFVNKYYPEGDDHNQTIAEFTDTYTPDAITLAVPVKKQIEGDPTPVTKTFRFSLTADTEKAPMPEGTEGTTAYATVAGSGESAFNLITFKAAGTYYYTVKELAGDDMGYTYDKVVYTVKAEVKDIKGKLEVTPTYTYDEKTIAELPLFVNKYLPNPTEVVFPVEKQLTGNPTPKDNDKEFTFNLVAVTEDAPMPEETVDGVASITIVGAGKAEYGAIKFEHAGVYEYEMTELEGGEPGYTYDLAVRHIVVTVVDNNGQLEATWTSEDEIVDEILFINDYTPSPVEVVLEAGKILRNKRLQAKMFSFTLTDENGKVLQEVTNTAEGKIVFDPIKFTAAGENTYTITEVKGNLGNITYDSASLMAIVTVTDDNGTLKAEVKYPKAPTFVNTFVPDIPKTGYGSDSDGWLYGLGCLSLISLLWSVRRKDKRTAK